MILSELRLMHRRDAMLDLGRLSLGSLALPALLRAGAKFEARQDGKRS